MVCTESGEKFVVTTMAVPFERERERERERESRRAEHDASFILWSLKKGVK